MLLLFHQHQTKKVRTPKTPEAMKTLKLILVCVLLTTGNLVKSQNHSLPDIGVYTLDGRQVSFTDVNKNAEEVVIFFWKTTDVKSLDQLPLINDAYENQPKSKKVRIIGICTDDGGFVQNIKPFVSGNNISMEIYVDQNNDLKRAMNVTETPCTIVIDRKQESRSMIAGYNPNIVDLINDRFERRLADVPHSK